MICSNCGKEIEEGLNFCPECGAAIAAVGAAPKAEPVNEAPKAEPAPAPAPQPAPAPKAEPQPAPAPAEMTKKDLPEKFRPLNCFAYWGLRILYGIPIVGLIFLIIHSFNPSNINRRAFARSYWISRLLSLAIVITIIVLGFAGNLITNATGLFGNLRDLIGYYF